jgi:cytochrome c oxidase assembly factor CtaG
MQMSGHMLLAQVVAPLLLLALPCASAAKVANMPAARNLTRILRQHSLTWMVGMGAMWAWHLPSVCQAVAHHPGLGLAEDICFLVSGMVFWWPIFSPLPRERMDPVPWAVLYLVSGCVSCTVLGIVLAFAPAAVFHFASGVQSGMPDMTAADQHTGGLIMWVPGCLIYLTAVIAMFARWYSAPEEAPISGHNAHAGSELML